MPRKKKEVVYPVDAPWHLIFASYTLYLGIALFAFGIADTFWGDQILTSVNALWGDGLVWAGLGKVWFIFAWAAGGSIALVLLGHRTYSPYTKTEQTTLGLWVSLNAGVFEEIVYRVLAFLACMPLLVFANFILFGAVEWIDTQILLPLANWATFGALEPQLLGPNWVYGAAIIFSVGLFRDEHEYLGFIGWVNSWFLGMLMFFLVFNYGLLTAIAAHFLYDAIIFTIRALSSEKETSLSMLFRRLIDDRR